MKGEKLKKIIRAHGYTVTSMAKRLGMYQQTLDRALSGDSVKSDLVESVAEALGISVADIYGSTENGGANIATANGEHASAVAGNNNTTTTGTDARWLDELSAQRKLTEKAMQQNSDLLAIVKVLSGAVTQK